MTTDDQDFAKKITTYLDRGTAAAVVERARASRIPNA